MIQFKKLVKHPKAVDPTNLLALFHSRDRQSTHTEPRQAQEQSLTALSARLEDRDVVLKLNTGAGKTAVGLIYLQAQLERYGRPVVYLCPTNQLVAQVMHEAGRIGLVAVHYAGGQPHPDVRGTLGTAIIVCTYDKLFNGHSTFDRPDVMLRPCAIVLDDAHTGVDKIRDKFRLTFDAETPVHKTLLLALRPSCSQQYPGAWREVESGRPHDSVEVPFWTWWTVSGPARDALHGYMAGLDAQDPKPDPWYAWPLVRDSLEWSRCIVSGTALEITPHVLPVDRCRAFSECPHRLYMSATLANDSALVRDLGCSVPAALNPISPAAGRGLGERMVVAPSLIDPSLDRGWLAQYCATLAASVNVVVLTSSAATAKIWVDHGADHVKEAQVAARVQDLRSRPPGSYTVFAQRYDGIDLPDDACRVLVIDGMPMGERLTDVHDAEVRGKLRQRLVNRIEQGMGRAVRSHVDYAVVILAGPEVAHFVARADVQRAMNPETRAQLRLAMQLADLAKKEAHDSPDEVLHSLVDQCLARDDGWKQYYQENVRDANVGAARAPTSSDAAMMGALRDAFAAAMGNDARRGADLLEKALASIVESERGEYLQLLATVTHPFNAGHAMEIQRSAYERDRTLLRPLEVARRPRILPETSQASLMQAWVTCYADANGAIIAIEEMRSRLAFSVAPKSLHKALETLADLVGAQGSRPDDVYGVGPDVLWQWDELSLVIEAKTYNEGALHKTDGSQLLSSLKWYEEAYPTRAQRIPIVLANSPDAIRTDDFPPDTRILVEAGVSKILSALHAFYGDRVHHPLLFASEASVRTKITEHGLAPDQFRSRYTVPLRRRKGAK